MNLFKELLLISKSALYHIRKKHLHLIHLRKDMYTFNFALSVPILTVVIKYIEKLFLL